MDEEGVVSPAPFKSLLFVHLSLLPLLQCAAHFKAASTMKVSKPRILVFSLFAILMLDSIVGKHFFVLVMKM